MKEKRRLSENVEHSCAKRKKMEDKIYFITKKEDLDDVIDSINLNPGQSVTITATEQTSSSTIKLCVNAILSRTTITYVNITYNWADYWATDEEGANSFYYSHIKCSGEHEVPHDI